MFPCHLIVVDISNIISAYYYFVLHITFNVLFLKCTHNIISWVFKIFDSWISIWLLCNAVFYLMYSQIFWDEIYRFYQTVTEVHGTHTQKLRTLYSNYQSRDLEQKLWIKDFIKLVSLLFCFRVSFFSFSFQAINFCLIYHLYCN